ncbi:chemotaxis protein CheW [Sporolactobacillus terrae]|uniref:Chemotaxis protein CheW n=1 Tax=Sporolactobacillus terrae TaxID=269673 RepID=A0A5K7X0I2_9BACL|nr:chemotaxis protein CheW [Sporolactobacillus terrae]BBO00432.1 chemotaxis protein CheW [Sporolactobacillus terrae]
MDEQIGITVFVGTEELSVSIDDVQEVIEPVPVLSVPVTHCFFTGLISLRGAIIPLVDLHSVLHESPSLFTNKDKKYIICRSGQKSIAIDIDSVGDTFSFTSDQVSAPANDKTVLQQLVSGQIRLADRELPLLSIARVIAYTSELNAKQREQLGYLAVH